jgi:hypothetical protein
MITQSATYGDEYLTTIVASQAAHILGTNPANLIMYSEGQFLKGVFSGLSYCKTTTIGTDGSMPNKLHNFLQLCEMRDNSDIKFVRACVSFGPYGVSIYYIFIEKGKAFKAKRSLIRLSARLNPPIAPVLNDALWGDLIDNTVGFFKKARDYKAYGVKTTRGIILSGPPGNGKSMFCDYLIRCFNNRGIDVMVYTSRDLIKTIIDNRNPFDFRVIFVDDVDIDFFSRKSNSEMACSLLSCLDGCKKTSSVALRIFSTNESIKNIDPAFLRPGRVDKCFSFDNPNTELRKKFINTWNQNILDGIDVPEFINRSEGFSFADMDLVKQVLVSNFLSSGKWDMSVAIGEFESRCSVESHRKTGIGFDNLKSAEESIPKPTGPKPIRGMHE